MVLRWSCKRWLWVSCCFLNILTRLWMHNQDDEYIITMCKRQVTSISLLPTTLFFMHSFMHALTKYERATQLNIGKSYAPTSTGATQSETHDTYSSAKWQLWSMYMTHQLSPGPQCCLWPRLERRMTVPRPLWSCPLTHSQFCHCGPPLEHMRVMHTDSVVTQVAIYSDH